jgi:hypothetical protein
MSSTRLLRALIFTALGAALSATGVPAAAHAPARVAAAPRLALKSLGPPTVRGTSFAGYERVTLTLRGLPGGDRVRHRRASADGSFTVAFAKAKAGHCDGFTVRANGDAGSRATLKRMQLPACSPS